MPVRVGQRPPDRPRLWLSDRRQLRRRARAVLGIPLAITYYDAVVDWIDAMVAIAARASTLSAAAVHLVMRAREDAAVREAVLGDDARRPRRPAAGLGPARARAPQCDARLRAGPDGAPLRARRRAPGTPIYLYGGRDEAALVDAAAAPRTRYPGTRDRGRHSPPYRELSAAEDDEAAARIDRSGAQIVWVGIGQPRQEQWMARMRARLSAPMLVAVGAAFDFHAGLVPQAPPWMGRHGLEWTYRLAREPRRLWRRYARYNPRFVAAFARQYAARAPHAAEPQCLNP